MTETSRLSPGRLVAFLMIGLGLIAIGIALFIMSDSYVSYTSSQDFSAIPVAVDYAAPDLTLKTLDGIVVSLDGYRGSVVLVNLWATWCPPCREEMPTLESFYKKYKDSGFVLIGINQEETYDVVMPFVREYGLTFPVWLDPDYLAERTFNSSGLPTSYVIDRSGKVRLMWVGGISPKNLEKYVPDLINE